MTTQLRSLTLTDQPMPKDGQSASINYPWGQVLIVTRIGGSYRDLAAQSTSFDWALKDQSGETVKSGSFDAIAGLCGTFGECYFPKVRRIESGLTKRVNVIAGDTDQPFCPSREMVVSADNKWIVSVKSKQYGWGMSYPESPIEIKAEDVLEPKYKPTSESMFVTKALFDLAIEKSGAQG